MPRKIDLMGINFGKLTVIEESQERGGRDIEWWCQCECGRISRVIGNNLRRKHTTSCGKCSLNTFYNTDSYMVGVTTRGEEFYFDIEDFEFIKQYSWYMNDKNYIVGMVNGKQNKMHRLILPQAEQVDHINNIRYDNRRENLRSVTNAQNQMNQLKCKTPKSSRYKGVSWHKCVNKWVSYIRVDKELILLGYYNIEVEAALAYNKAASFYFGEYANLNIIQTRPEYYEVSSLERYKELIESLL